MVRQVPTWMLEDDRYRRIVEVFEALGSIHLEHADQLEHVFDPSVAPPAMVRLMGRWIGVDLIDPELPELLQREIVREMGRLARWRGTRDGLQGVLELVTREPVEVVDPAATFEEGSEPPAPGGCVVIHVRSTGWIDEHHFVELVRREVPANVPFELWLGDRRLWPPPPEEDEGEASTTVVCPVCGQPAEAGPVRMAADEFCAVCDYPLFWVPGRRRADDPAIDPDAAGSPPDTPSP
jgi:phage tail-like protein